ncbi:MAG: hypothetical protein JWR89_1828 [Tardiphaga sp.]|uniref:hypothetical protein n=1 Tax=Tardiphaga sp. TaxID=1926292 RepID=UPI0026137BEB|nr:hypothetical protein [Tardiphaga sp.]MDB5501926.1 hypothetical protein [Tardiphaga sp.]
MRKLCTLCAAAGIVVTAFAATAPAHAAYHLIRWQDTGFCQIWDENIPTTPYPSNYTTIMGAVAPTFLDALIMKDGLLRAGTCSF